MLKKIKNLKKELGQSMVETALCLPLILLILCGTLDFGYIYSQKYEVEHACFEGARYITLYSETLEESDLVTNVTQRVKDNIDRNQESVTVNVEKVDQSYKIVVSKPIKCLTFVASTFFGDYYTCTVTYNV